MLCLCLYMEQWHNMLCVQEKSSGGGKKEKKRRHLLIVQQQHDGIQLLPWTIIRSKRDNKIVQAVARRLCRHNDQLVLKAVGLCVFVTVVLAALETQHHKCPHCEEVENRLGFRVSLWPQSGGILIEHKDTVPIQNLQKWPFTLSRRKQQNGALTGKRWQRVGELPM